MDMSCLNSTFCAAARDPRNIDTRGSQSTLQSKDITDNIVSPAPTLSKTLLAKSGTINFKIFFFSNNRLHHFYPLL